MPKVKCCQCGKQIDRNDAKKMANGYYVCSELCEERWQDAHKSKENPNGDMRKKLFAYIKEQAPNADMRVTSIQLAKMLKDNTDMTYGGVLYTLMYLRSLGYDLSKSPLGLVPYKYNEAWRHYEWQRAMKRQVAAWNQNDDEVEIIKRNVEEEVFD